MRLLIGALAATMLLLGGFFIWSAMSKPPQPALKLAAAAPPVPSAPDPLDLPEGEEGAVGALPPGLPRANPLSREQRRFQRYDRNRDGGITRVEMLSTRSSAFRRLDKDGDNLLSFEEWAVRTSDRFAQADRDRSGIVTPAEFARTAPKPRAAAPRCRCPADDD